MPAEQWKHGLCWLYCGQDDVLVTWIGPATTDGLTVPMYACRDCIGRLAGLVWRESTRRDSPRSEPAPARVFPYRLHRRHPRRRGRHARPTNP